MVLKLVPLMLAPDQCGARNLQRPITEVPFFLQAGFASRMRPVSAGAFADIQGAVCRFEKVPDISRFVRVNGLTNADTQSFNVQGRIPAREVGNSV